VLHEDVDLGTGLFTNAICLSFTVKQTETDASRTLAGVCAFGGLLSANFHSLRQRSLDATTLLPKAPPGLYVADVSIGIGETEDKKLPYIYKQIIGKMANHIAVRCSFGVFGSPAVV